MTNKMNINISGGKNRFDHIEQGDRISAEGPIVLNYSPELFNDSRSRADAAACALGIADAERDTLKQQLAELESQIKAGANVSAEPALLDRIGATVAKIDAAFGWTRPIVKNLLIAASPALATLLIG